MELFGLRIHSLISAPSRALWVGYSGSIPAPDFDDFVAYIEGRGPDKMPLTEEEKDRIREIEQVRAEAQRQSVMEHIASPFSGPEVGKCTSCGKGLQMNWQFCPYCGEASSTSCPRCHFPGAADPA